MKTIQINSNSNISKPLNTGLGLNIDKLKNDLKFFMAYTYMVIIAVVFLIAIIEVKNMFQIDLFPGFDTPFDNIYFKEVGGIKSY